MMPPRHNKMIHLADKWDTNKDVKGAGTMSNHSEVQEHWVHSQYVNDVALESFATSIAALADQQTTPQAALEQVLATISDNLNASGSWQRYDAEILLRQKACEIGYEDMMRFHTDLVARIAEQMSELCEHPLYPEYLDHHKQDDKATNSG